MRAASAGDPGPDMPVAERAAVTFLRSDDVELDLHTAAVMAELVAADVPEEERLGFVQLWISELRDALRRHVGPSPARRLDLGAGAVPVTGTEPERIRISASRMVELKPRIAALLADGWTMTRMDKPVAEGCGQDVVVLFERRRCDTT
ncbi:hypothetical protein [Gordonia amarae]|uniref:hypothetical protein n=1 Tax=Gordonia amarae TaxID=36821 RepID=UPI0020BDDAE5|nr:hypothetical protein [Gordonia amarae]